MRNLKTILVVITTVIISLFPRNAAGQDVEREMARIKSNHQTYYWGIGAGRNWDEAKKNALGDLVRSISVNISSSEELTTHSVSLNGKESISTEIASKINTYTKSIHLDDAKSLMVKEDEKGIQAFCYIEKSIVMKSFEERRAKAINLMWNGDKYEKERNISDALRYYYYSLLMLKSLIRPDTVTCITPDGQRENMANFLERHIQNVINGVEITATEISSNDNKINYSLDVTYHGEKVTSCEYRYWENIPVDWEEAKNGLGSAVLTTDFASRGKLRIEIKYVFKDRLENMTDPDLNSIAQNMGDIDIPVFKNSREIPLGKAKVEPVQAVTATVAQPAITDKKKKLTEITPAVQDSCSTIINNVIKAIQNKKAGSVKNSFTEEGWGMFTSLINNGNAIVTNASDLRFLSAGDIILCRPVPMRFKFPRSGKTINEKVEFRFRADDLKIESVAFTLSDIAESDILNPDKQWSDTSRMILLQFLENYQTAYSLRRIDYLDSIFSENALIITGTRVASSPKIENAPSLKSGFTYRKMDKRDYINRLRKLFSANEFVNIRFKNNEVIRDIDSEIYGIQIDQIYTSSSYADEGYLFLVVDLRDYKKPIIHVRTWQPEKDPDFGLFKLESFKLY